MCFRRNATEFGMSHSILSSSASLSTLRPLLFAPPLRPISFFATSRRRRRLSHLETCTETLVAVSEPFPGDVSETSRPPPPSLLSPRTKATVPRGSQPPEGSPLSCSASRRGSPAPEGSPRPDPSISFCIFVAGSCPVRVKGTKSISPACPRSVASTVRLGS